MATNIRQIKIGISKTKQTDIETKVTETDDFLVFRWNDPVVPIPQFINESDENDLGKGSEFATQLFPSHKTGQFTLTGHLSSEKLAWAAVFGLGKFVKSGADPTLTYTCNEYDPVADGIERPHCTIVVQIPGSGVDLAVVGCVVTGFRVTLRSGPGRDNAQIAIDFRMSGRDVQPSDVTLPAATTEHFLNAASLTGTVVGVDYVALKRFVNIEWGWQTETDEEGSIFPGSGTQDGFAVAGRIEDTRRVPIFNMQARLAADSAELAALKAQTTGVVTIDQTSSAAEEYLATFQKLGFETAEVGNANGIVTIQVTGRAMQHASNGVIDIVAETAIDDIGTVQTAP